MPITSKRKKYDLPFCFNTTKYDVYESIKNMLLKKQILRINK